MSEAKREFVQEWLRLEAGERDGSLTALCEEFQISRKTGYATIGRFKDAGFGGLEPRSHAPHNPAHQMDSRIREVVLALRRKHPTWGPRKLLDALARREPARKWPAPSTVGDLLRREGLVSPRRRIRRSAPYSQPLGHSVAPNVVWCVDFKGWTRTADGRRIDPLTITDACTRMLLRCQIVDQPSFDYVQPVFAAAFREFGLPLAIRSDNGPPFSTLARCGLSRLSVWWIRLGICPERIEPGKPQQNGRHERMHRTLKDETLGSPAPNRDAQQRRFNRFRHEYNFERPHDALGGLAPADLFEPSPRPFPRVLPRLEYPSDAQVRRVRTTGEVRWRGGLVFVGEPLVGEQVALWEREDGWHMYFGPVHLGLVDHRTNKLN